MARSVRNRLSSVVGYGRCRMLGAASRVGGKRIRGPTGVLLANKITRRWVICPRQAVALVWRDDGGRAIVVGHEGVALELWISPEHIAGRQRSRQRDTAPGSPNMGDDGTTTTACTGKWDEEVWLTVRRIPDDDRRTVRDEVEGVGVRDRARISRWGQGSYLGPRSVT